MHTYISLFMRSKLNCCYLPSSLYHIFFASWNWKLSKREGGMIVGLPQSFNLNLLYAFLVLLCFPEFICSSLNYVKSSVVIAQKKDALLPQILPSEAPQPLLPLLAPSPFAPFANSTIPTLSGSCILNFEALEGVLSTTSIDCGGNDTLQKICSILPSNLTEGSCLVKDVYEVERTVDSSGLLAACEKIDTVNECCEQVCQNAIAEAAGKLARKTYDFLCVDGSLARSDHLARINDCKTVALRWLASKLDPSKAKEVLRALTNCKINKVCPLVFPNTSHVINSCGNGISDLRACCNAVDSYMSHLQNQSFVTNLQALNCAASLGLKLQKANITKNIYNLCHISLKDFSVQVTPQGVESGCLLPSLPSDAVFDQSTGLSFVCDLNDNIPAPWPSLSRLPASSCNKSVKIPALPAAASGQNSIYSAGIGNGTLLLLLLIFATLLVQLM